MSVKRIYSHPLGMFDHPFSVFFEDMYTDEINQATGVGYHLCCDYFMQDDKEGTSGEYSGWSLKLLFGSIQYIAHGTNLYFIGLNDYLSNFAVSANEADRTATILSVLPSLSDAEEITLPKLYRDASDSIYEWRENETENEHILSVVSISSSAFNSVSSIQRVTIPSTVSAILDTSIVNKAETFEIDPANEWFAYEDGALYSKDKTTLLRLRNDISTISLDSSLSAIDSNAFDGISQLSVTIADENPYLSAGRYAIYDKSTGEIATSIPAISNDWVFWTSDASKITDDTFKYCCPFTLVVNDKLSAGHEFSEMALQKMKKKSTIYFLKNTYNEIVRLQNYPWGCYRKRTFVSYNYGTGVVVFM